MRRNTNNFATAISKYVIIPQKFQQLSNYKQKKYVKKINLCNNDGLHNDNPSVGAC